MASTSKKQLLSPEANFESEGDKISSLPDDILVYILSFLSTKDAFRTSILSLRWKNLWASVPNLMFYPTEKWDWGDVDQDPRYMNFIDMILLLHNPNVNKFSIVFTPQTDQSRLHAWIIAVLKQNVQEIVIEVHSYMHLRLPRSLFSCDTLVKLTLGLCFDIDVPSLIHFPCLKELDISLKSPSSDLTRNLFRSSPVLENLSIYVYWDSGESVYDISSPALKKLRFSISAPAVENFDSVVKVDAPLLESLMVADHCLGKYLLKNSCSLLNARVAVDVGYRHDQVLHNILPADRMVTLLKSVSNVECLSLGGRCPLAAFSSTSECKWPVFSNVTCLEMDVRDDLDNEGFSRWPAFPKVTYLKLLVKEDYASKNLSHLLMLVPNLVSLVLVNMSGRVDSKEFNCSEQLVPSCFLSCLTEIKVIYVEGLRSDLNLITYFLTNAKVLEKVTIGFSIEFSRVMPRKAKKKFRSKIIRIPRCSKNCKLVFI